MCIDKENSLEKNQRMKKRRVRSSSFFVRKEYLVEVTGLTFGGIPAHVIPLLSVSKDTVEGSDCD
jgi:hypothetical protein